MISLSPSDIKIIFEWNVINDIIHRKGPSYAYNYHHNLLMMNSFQNKEKFDIEESNLISRGFSLEIFDKTIKIFDKCADCKIYRFYKEEELGGLIIDPLAAALGIFN
jgi:hypothetical protein